MESEAPASQVRHRCRHRRCSTNEGECTSQEGPRRTDKKELKSKRVVTESIERHEMKTRIEISIMIKEKERIETMQTWQEGDRGQSPRSLEMA